MKIWRFYIIPEKDDTDKSYELYALTNNKEKAMRFMKERDMDKFYVRSTKEELETYSKIANDNRDCVLDYFEFTTKYRMENGFYGKKTVKILCTEYEHIISTDESESGSTFMDEFFWITAQEPKAFSKELRKALKTIEYERMYQIFSNDPSIDYNDYSAPDVSMDEVGLFVKLFKRLFK